MASAITNPFEVQDMIEVILAHCDDHTAARVASTCRVAKDAFQTTAEQREVRKIYPKHLQDEFSTHGRPIHTLAALDVSEHQEDVLALEEASMRSPLMRFKDRYGRYGVAIHIQSREAPRESTVFSIFQRDPTHNSYWAFSLPPRFEADFRHAHTDEVLHRSCGDCPFPGGYSVNFSTVVGPLLAGTYPAAQLVNRRFNAIRAPARPSPLAARDTLGIILAYCDDPTAARMASTCLVAKALFQTMLESRKMKWLERPEKVKSSYPQPLQDLFAAHGRPIHTLDVLDIRGLGERATFRDAPMSSPVMRFTSLDGRRGLALRIQSRQSNLIQKLFIFQNRGMFGPCWAISLNHALRTEFELAHLNEINSPEWHNSCEDCPASELDRARSRIVVEPLLAGTHPTLRLAD